jgi:hypothetical protein
VRPGRARGRSRTFNCGNEGVASGAVRGAETADTTGKSSLLCLSPKRLALLGSDNGLAGEVSVAGARLPWVPWEILCHMVDVE